MSALNSIKHLNPCSEARAWAREQPSLEEAWKVCHNGSWMLWLIGKTINSLPWSDDRKPLLLCALECAESVKHLWSESKVVEIGNCITILRNWTMEGVSLSEAKEARRRLYDAASDAAYAAAYTAYAAAYAAAAYAAAASDAAASDAAAYAAAASDAASAAAYTAAAAAYAAAYAADADARSKILFQCADIVRRHYPNPPTLEFV